MRITTNQLYQNSLNGILDAQKRLVRAQDVLVKQTNILKPSDDPAAATKVVRLNEDLARLDQFEKNTILLENSLENKDVVLNNIHSSMGRARNLTLQAGNGALAKQDREAIAIELEQIKEELFDMYNSKNGQGEYIFSGSKSSEPAFIQGSDGQYEYQGNENVKKIQISESLKIASGVPGSGFAIFENTDSRSTISIDAASTATGSYRVNSGDQFEAFHRQNYATIPATNNEFNIVLTAADAYEVQDNAGAVLETGNLSSENKLNFKGLEFTVNGNAGDELHFSLDAPNKDNTLNSLTQLIDKLRGAETLNESYYSEINAAVYSIDESMGNVSAARSEIGGRLNVVTSVNLSNLDQEINLKEAKAKISEVDFAEAITELQKQEVALQAANQTFSKVTGLTLFNFL
ncbi:flagellar hook-associated protein FlgL [Algibacillus agarilyticus]|uniref:flagellar hook-associated protein FlgL n=1 Tax=Algibacillus agarilyticus TaxID=2234133 RepID=UPI000DD02606|nr:flagellar hook-associated protein FlgL [Algibacillus agarilyticus]